MSLLSRRFAYLFIGIAVLAVFLVGFSNVFAQNIDPVNKYATVDADNDSTDEQINFNPTNGGVTVSAAGTSGYAWGESLGWINTNPTNGGVDLTCDSNGVGTFSGYWWGKTAGWINLEPTNGGLTLTADGEFEGDVWASSYGGWITFDCGNADSCVETSYTCPIDEDDNDSTSQRDASCRLTASDTSIAPGDPVVISWSTNILDGNYTTAEIDPLGSVNGDDGSITVYPIATTTFEALFEGNFLRNAATCEVTVTLGTEEPPTEEEEEDPVVGCTDSGALNYNAAAEIDNGSCRYIDTPFPPEEPEDYTYGCIDPRALNYDSTVDFGDDSCQYEYEDEEEETPPIDDEFNPGVLKILKQRYVVSENVGSLVITVVREGGSDGTARSRLQMNNGTALRGQDFESAESYELIWQDGDTTSRDIIIAIIADDIPEGRETFSANLVETTGATVAAGRDYTNIIITDTNRFPWALTTVSAIALIIAGASTLPFRIQNILLAIPAYRRRHRPWGTVYDSRTKEPLDPAYVQLFDEAGNEIASSITDLDGRYGFLVPPGTYYITAGKTHYSYPSKELVGKTSDTLYTDLYFGEPIVITEEGQVITKNIPMDAVGEDWNQQAKGRMKVAQFFRRHDTLAHKIIDVLFVAGLGFSVYAVMVSPIWFNWLVLGLYGLVILLNILGLSSRNFGIVTSSTSKQVGGSIVRAYNARLNKEIAHRVVADNGAYYMLVQNGEYYLTVEQPRTDGSMQHVYTSESITVKNGIIKKNIKI